MAKACSPYAGPRYVQRANESTEDGGWFAKILAAQNLANGAADVRPREGYYKATQARLDSLLRNMLPLDPEDLKVYLQRQGYLKLDQKLTKAEGADVFTIKRDIDPERMGDIAAATKIVVDSYGGGLRQLASTLLNKVAAGEDATTEALQFGKQAKAISGLMGHILGWDQARGRSLLIDRIANMGPRAIRDAEKFVQQTGQDIDLMGIQGDLLTAAARKLGNPDTATDGLNDLIALAKRVQFADTPSNAFKITGSIQLAGGAFNEMWINGLLSSPATIVTNGLGFTWAYARPISQLVAAGLWQGVGLPGKQAAKQAMAEAAATLTAMNTAWNDALKLGWHAFKTEQQVYQAVTASGRIEERVPSITAETFKQLGISQIDDSQEKMLNELGKFIRLPSRALLGSDEFVKHLAVRGEVAARAVQWAVQKEGVDPSDGKKLAAAVEAELGKAFNLQHPDIRQRWAIDRGYEGRASLYEEINVATFQEPNALATWFTKGIEKAPALRPFFPFIKTPANILRQGFWESTGMEAAWKGAGIVMSEPTKAVFNIQKALMEDPGESFRVAGQVGMASVLVAGVWGGVMNGQITGGGPGRWSAGGARSPQQQAWEKMIDAQGRAKYSVQTPFGAIPFDRFGEPMAIVLRMAADAAELASYMEGEEQDKVVAGIAGIVASGWYQASFMKGVNSFVDIWSQTGEQMDASGKIATTLQNWTSTFTPFGGMLNYLDKVKDPYRSAYEGGTLGEIFALHETGFGKGLFGKIADRLPGNGNIPMLIDQVTGEPVPLAPGIGRNGLNPLELAIPFFPRGRAQADQTWERIYSIMGGYTETRDPNLRLSRAQQQEVNRLMSQARVGGLLFREWVDQLYGTAEVQAYIKNRSRMDDGVRSGIESTFKSMQRQYFRTALRQYARTNPEIARRMALVESINLHARSNDMSAVSRDQQELQALIDSSL